MEWKEFTGKTVDDALMEAATFYKTASSELEVTVLQKPTNGFLGIGAKPAVIQAAKKDTEDESLEDVSVEISETAGEEKKNEDIREKTDAENFEETESAGKKSDEKKDSPEYPVDKNEEIDPQIIEITENYLKELFRIMEIEATFQVTLDQENKTLSIDVEGPDMAVIIGKRGQTLDSLQYLISLYVKKKSNTYVRVKLDTENYRERRKETLETLANHLALKVKKTGRPYRLEPMNPYERRIIHSALQGNRYVVTKSEGEEPYRRVVILPKNRNSYRQNKNRSEER